MHGTAKIIESRPILKLLGGQKRYERFVLEGMGEEHNEKYYALEDQRFLGEEGFSQEISEETKEIKGKKKMPIAAVFKKVARQMQVSPEVLRGPDRRWEITRKRSEAVAVLVREYGYRVGEVAEYLGRDQAHISTMLSRLAARPGELG
jgi:chromosomal replication initiation ATPase DnaA